MIYFTLNPQVKLPFKRYEVGKVFRDGPISSERFREFWQCDVDVVGVKGMAADAEVITLASRFFKKIGFDCVIRINSRKLLNDLLEYCGVKKDKLEAVILSIDKLEKFGAETVKKELKNKKIDSKIIDKLLEIISIKGTNNEKINEIKKMLINSEGIKEIEELIGFLSAAKVILKIDSAQDPTAESNNVGLNLPSSHLAY